MDSLDSGDQADPRDIELSSLEAIYPEIQRVRKDDPYTISLEVPVNPTKAVVVFFPAANDATAPADRTDSRANGDGHAGGVIVDGDGQVDSHELAYLPSIHLEIALGPSYPAENPPRLGYQRHLLGCRLASIKRLEDDSVRLWEEMGRDIVVFTYIDHIQQLAEDVFGLVGEKGSLEIDPAHKIAILDYDIEAKRRAFEKETFDCGVCLGMSWLLLPSPPWWPTRLVLFHPRWKLLGSSNPYLVERPKRLPQI